MIELLNEPVPEPLVVKLFAVVGDELVLQQTPRAVTLAPPSLLTFPPAVALVLVIVDAAVVVSVGCESTSPLIQRTDMPFVL